MRARNIKPGFFKNEYLAECSPAARLLFIGLWMLADREGRLEYRPKRWKGELFPYENEDAAALFSELEKDGELVVKYAAEGVQYVWIPHFLDHQKPHQNESASTIPPYTCDQGTKDLSPRHEVLATKEQSDPAESLFSDSLNPDSGLLNADTLNPRLGANVQKQPAPLPPGQASPEYSMEFELLWEQYPRKEAKESAWIAFKAAKAAHAYPGNPIVLPLVVQWRESPRWLEDDGKYIPMLANWISGKRWEDELTAAQLRPKKKPQSKAQVLQDQNVAAMQEWLESKGVAQ